MPEFPRYQSKEALTTQQPSAAAVSDTKGQVLENQAKNFGNVSEAAVKWANAVDTIQKTAATANFKTGMLGILKEAQNDPNDSNSKDYLQRIDKLRTDNLKGFATKTAETEMSLNFGYESKVAGIQINNIYKKKMIDTGRVKTLELIDSEVNNPTDSSLGNIQKLLNTQVHDGLLSHTDAYKLADKANEDLGVNRISRDLYQAQTPAAVGAVKDAINSNYYEKGGVSVDPVKKLQLFNRATKMETYLHNTQRDATENDMAKREIDGDLSMPEVESAFKNDLISRSFYESRKKTLDSTLADTAHTDPQTFNKITAFLVNPKANATDARNIILQASADGKLSQSDLESLYTMHLIPSKTERMNLEQALGEQGKNDFQKIKNLHDSQDKLLKDKNSWWHSSFKMIDETLGKDSQGTADAKLQLYGNIHQTDAPANEVPKEARKVLNAAFLKTHPQITSYPKEGKVVGSHRYFPDGTSQEEPSK